MTKARKTHRQRGSDLLKMRNVVGTGAGRKIVNGQQTEQAAILVFVTEKHDPDEIRRYAADELIPETIDGIPTDVIEVGHIEKQQYTTKVRPLHPGYSCGHRRVTAGTIGGFFTDGDGDVVVLSNCHVLANEGEATAGDPIYQPGISDGPRFEQNGFATLKRFTPLKDGGNRHDSAIATIDPAILAQRQISHLYPDNRAMVGIARAQVGQSAQKWGRTTGYTTGKVIALDATFTISYDRGPAKFVNCMVLSAMSKPGDSGSIIFDDQMYAIGLLFAGSLKVTLASPMETVAAEYGLQPWAPVGAAPAPAPTPIPTPATPSLRTTIDFLSARWTRVAAQGATVVFDGRQVNVTAGANRYACWMHRVQGASHFEVVVNQGTDQGATWGPGLVLCWQNNAIKLNLRPDALCSDVNGNETIVAKVLDRAVDYTLRIRRVSGQWISDVKCGEEWVQLSAVPASSLPGTPNLLRIGKTGIGGRLNSHNDAGSSGIATYRSILVA